MEDSKSIIQELEARIKFLELAQIEMRDNILAAAKSQEALPTLAAILTMHVETLEAMDAIIGRFDFGSETAQIDNYRKMIFEDIEAIGDVMGWEGQDELDS